MAKWLAVVAAARAAAYGLRSRALNSYPLRSTSRFNMMCENDHMSYAELVIARLLLKFIVSCQVSHPRISLNHFRPCEAGGES